MKQLPLFILLLISKFICGQTNGSFENWDTVYPGVYSQHLDTAFSVPNPIGGEVEHWKSDFNYGISRTTDSYSGSYSLILHNWYQYVMQSIYYQEAVNFKPQFLQGYYKYRTDAAKPAQGNIQITLTRFNGSSTDTIAKGYYLFDSTSNFQPFQVELVYNSSLTPDSIHIVITNANRDCVDQNMVCNLLYLDALSLNGDPSGLSILNAQKIAFYPNPTKEVLAFELPDDQVYSLRIYDNMGRLNKSASISRKSTVSTSGLSDGIYFITLQNKDGRIVMTDKVVKE